MIGISKANEIMIPISDYPVIYGSDTMHKAIMQLYTYHAKNQRHRSLLVFSKNQKINGEELLIGVLTVGDILRAMKKITMSYNVDELMELAMSFKAYDKDVRNEQERIMRDGFSAKVSDSIRPLVHAFVQSGDDITKAVNLMMIHNVHVLPVFEAQRAVGILRAMDIMDYVVDVLDIYTQPKTEFQALELRL